MVVHDAVAVLYVFVETITWVESGAKLPFLTLSCNEMTWAVNLKLHPH